MLGGQGDKEVQWGLSRILSRIRSQAGVGGVPSAGAMHAVVSLVVIVGAAGQNGEIWR